MRNKEATEDDDVDGDVLKLLGVGDLRIIIIKLINTFYETGEYPKGFTDVTMIALKKKAQTTKCSDHRTGSLIAHTARRVTKKLRRRIERKLRMYSEKISLDLEEEKEVGMQLGCRE